MVALKSLRSCLELFLKAQAHSSNTSMFTVPISRKGMAEHLHADRAALPSNLSRIKAEGLIDYHRNSFRLLRIHALESAAV